MVKSWGVACRPKAGQTISGDVYVYEVPSDSHILAAVIDGLGSGAEAAEPAQRAAPLLRTHPDWPLQELVRVGHQELHNTRGAVIGLLRLNIHTSRATYVGVGNIGIFVHSNAHIKPISKNGILGARLPASLLELSYTYHPGDTFVLYSDGISVQWSIDPKLDIHLAPQTLAETVLVRYGKLNDDATVLVVRPS